MDTASASAKRVTAKATGASSRKVAREKSGTEIGGQRRGHRADQGHGAVPAGGLQDRVHDQRHRGSGQDRGQHVGHPREQAPRHEPRPEGGEADEGRRRIHRIGMAGEERDRRERVEGGRDLRAEEVLELVDRDEDRGAGGEPRDDRVGHEVHEHAEPGDAEHELDHAHHQGEGDRIGDVLRASRRREGAERGEQHDGGRGGRAGHEQPGRAEQGGDDGRDHRRVEPVLGRHAGDRGEGDALREDHEHAGHGGQRVRTHGVAIDVGPPLQERRELALDRAKQVSSRRARRGSALIESNQ